MLTFGRLVAAPCIGYLVLQHNYDAALGLFAAAGITDLVKYTQHPHFFVLFTLYQLDGHIARKYNMKSLLGTIIDPMADKVLMTIMTVTLAMEGTLPGNKSATKEGKKCVY